MVRPGLALYGYGAAAGRSSRCPSHASAGEIIAIRDLPEGALVGYGGSFRTARPSRIATIAVGYGDGLMRALSNRGVVLVGGRRCAIVGRVAMDLTTVDVTDLPAARVGHEAVLLGAQGGERLDAVEVADSAGTIPYEVLTSISRRVPRFYI